METQHIYALSVEGALEQMATHLHRGLTGAEATARLEQYGWNELLEQPRPGFLRMLWEQFRDFLVRILIVAAIISLFLGEWVDASAILTIVILNAVIGVVQQSRAEQSLAALKKMAAPNARVVRDGVETSIPARELVPGDIVLLEAGNYVPADIRLIESVNLKVDEASLTGESVPVNKDARVVLDREIPMGDRKNSAFMGTLVTYGRGKGLVTSTGMRTQLGMIAEMIQSSEQEPTPLQRRLDQLGKWLGIVSLAVCGVVFAYGLIRDTHPGIILTQGFLEYLRVEQKDIIELFMTAVSLAIAAVPEGLPAVVTICLALGMQRMVRRHALIRRLPAVETLGCATVICSDKTGTLTQNQMTVVRGWAAGQTFQVSGEGYHPAGTFSLDGRPFDPRSHPAANLLLHGMLLCNDARLERSGEENGRPTYRMVGDPTEGALVVAAAKAGLWRENLAAALPRVAEIPFDAERKRMATFHQIADPAALPEVDHSPYIVLVKGAPDLLLEVCDDILVDGQVQALSAGRRQEVLDANVELARQALRVLGLAYRPLADVPETPTPDNAETQLVFVGLLGMIDPARSEVKTAVQVAHGAGLRSVMVTGDYRDTAEAIAQEIGLRTPGGQVLTGAELDRMTEAQLVEVCEQVDVYARVSPAHKIKIVAALKARGHIVAMTGDGVNDAPALKRADIGVAMGITGTDVAKETADMVLTDDNYASIVSAIEEGRIIYANIRKFVYYLISCNIGEILVIFLAMLIGLPIPLTPIMLLWLNLVTDGAPALALGMEEGDPDTMNRPPRPAKEPVINREMLIGVIVQAIVMTAAVLGAFVYGLNRYPDNLAGAQTVAFATLIVSELLRAYTARSERHPLLRIGVWGNKWMQYAVGSSLALLVAVVYVPFLRAFFGTAPLTLTDWLLMAPFFLAASVAAEATKAVQRRRAAGSARA